MKRTHSLPSRHSLALAVAFAIAGFASAAGANPAFPGLLQSNLQMPCVPSCGVCHLNPAGGGDMRPGGFGANMASNYGLAYDPSTFAPALAAAMNDGHDSDADTIPDITELKAGSDLYNPDPNAVICGAGANTIDTPTYGCGARIAPGHDTDSLALLTSGAALALGAALLRRRSRR